MLSALIIGCVFQPSWVSPQAVLRGAPDTPSFKPFLSRSFMVRSTHWVGIWVCKVIKYNCFMRWRFDIWRLCQVARSRILGGIWTCRGVRPRKVAHYDR